MESELLYFFSTMPQIISAIVALVFVFVFFKLQSINKEINVLCRKFTAILGNNATLPRNWQDLGSGPEFMNNYLSENFKDISAIMYRICEEREKDNKNATDKLKTEADKVSLIEKHTSSLIKNTKNLALFSFFLIIASLSIIPFVKVVNSNCLWTYLLFSVFTIFIVIDLLGVYLILSKSLK